ncbi:MAG TPA: trypsin-like peptidase domain-containing protein [Candidatus Polarisedimenticolaceae bacterium]|nr:trypsin-like peptidase domain-containing protein [Candidatus Polarisedimenticolaceae bacterium]
MNRKGSFAALLGVVGISIVFGMIVGGKLNAPPVMHAAAPAASAFPAASSAAEHTVALPDFSEIAASILPAVVGVQNTTVDKKGGGDSGQQDEDGDQFDDPIFRFFFGPNGPQDRRAHPRIVPREPQRRVSSGSGFIVTDDGYILTNNHVVEGATKLQVTLDTGEKYEAEVIGTDPMIDLGLIKIDPKGKTLPTVPLGDSDTLRVGQWVMAVGNPLALERTVTVGVVSGKKRQVQVSDTVVPALANFIQTDAAINFGNSGGPLLDGQGRVVGINTAIFRGELAEGIGFAIPINEARKAAEELRSGGSVKRGYLGIWMNTQPIGAKAQSYYHLPDRNGVIVTRITPGGPADDAGLQEGDLIRKLDGDPVKDNQDLLAKIAARKPGESVKLEVLRGGKTERIDVKLSTRPVSFDDPGNEPESKQDGEAVPSSEGLGIKIQAIPPMMRQQLEMDANASGVMIVSVDPESDAAEEGIAPRQVVTSMDDTPVKTVADWNRIVRALKPGQTVKVELDLGHRKELVFLTVPSKSK